MPPAELLRRVRRLSLYARRAAGGPLGGAYHSAFKGAGLEFADVRPYQPGDDVRRLDPATSARTGRPHVRRHVEQRELTVLLAVDASASLDFGTGRLTKRDAAAELAALVAFAAAAHRDRVGLLLFADRVLRFVPPAAGPTHALRVVRDVLAAASAAGGTDLAGALAYLGRVRRRRAALFLVSDFRAAHFERPLKLAARRHDLTAVCVTDPAERELPDLGLAWLADAETGERRLTDTAHPAARAAYRAAADARRASLAAACRAAGAGLVEAGTDGGHVEALVRHLRRRAAGHRANTKPPAGG